MRKVLLYGWYSADNLGDDFMLETTYQFLKKNNIDVKILLKKEDRNYFEDYQNDRYDKIEYYLYKNYSKNKILNKVIKVLKMIKFALFSNEFNEFDSIIFIGGGYINSVFNFFELINMYLLSKKFKNVYFTGQTVGPFKNKITEKIAKEIYKNAKEIFVREKFSDKLLNKYKIKHKLVADDAFLLNRDIYDSPTTEVKEENKYILVNVKDFKGYQEIQEKYFDIINNIANKLNYNVVCVPFRSDTNSSEYKINSDIVDKLKSNKINAIISVPKNINELKNIYQNSEFVIGTAYHSVTLALLFNKMPYSTYIGDYYKMKIQGILSFYNLEENNCFNILDEDIDSISNKIIKNSKNNEKIRKITDNLCEEINKSWYTIIGEEK